MDKYFKSILLVLKEAKAYYLIYLLIGLALVIIYFLIKWGNSLGV